MTEIEHVAGYGRTLNNAGHPPTAPAARCVRVQPLLTEWNLTALVAQDRSARLDRLFDRLFDRDDLDDLLRLSNVSHGFSYAQVRTSRS